MPAVRRNKQLTTSSGMLPSHYCYNDAPIIQLDSLSLAPNTSETDGSSDPLPPPPAKKKRSHGKARPPGHIPRPPNAFIIFRTEYIKAQATQNSTPEVSKNLGEMWRNFSPIEKQPYVEKAEVAKLQHQLAYPDYKYKPVHRRDEFGNCIRKPRSPNRPRVKKTAHSADVLDHLQYGSLQWLEAKPAAEFPNADLPSDVSSVSSPPPSPSPAPSLHGPSASTSYLSNRRSSSVPLTGPDDNFFFNTAPSSGYPAPAGFHAGHVRRLSKRPSTSMDFMCGGLGHSGLYGLTNGTEMYLSPNDSSQWRLGHRRSISAPGFNEVPNLMFPSPSVPQEANTLTPINPVFGNVFDRFSWNTPQTLDPSYPQNTQASFTTLPSSALGHKQHDYIAVPIPLATVDSASNQSTANLQPVPTTSIPAPAILHPAPVATFDFAAFEEQMNRFEFDAVASHGEYEDPLSVGAQTCLPDAGAVHNADEQFFVPSGDSHTITAAVEATGTTAVQSTSDPATLLPRPAAADIQGYQEGVRYIQRCPEIITPRVLDFNELIVDTY